MYTIDDLNVKLLSELKDLAEQMGVKNAKKLSKQELVYKILDEQAVKGDAPGAKKPAASNDRMMRPRKRENVAPNAAGHHQPVWGSHHAGTHSNSLQGFSRPVLFHTVHWEFYRDVAGVAFQTLLNPFQVF